MKNNSSAKMGLDFAKLLTIVFIVLKLCNVVEWSWLLVLSPIWVPITLYLLILGIVFCFKALKNRGTIQCKICKYRGCLISNTISGTEYYCTKDKCNHPTDYRCKDGKPEV